MRIILSFFAAASLAAAAVPAQAAPTPEQQQEISDCGTMAQAVQLFAEARDKGLSQMDAFKSVTQGRAVYKPGSRVDETLQWAYAHTDEKPEAAAAHFSGRCTLNALDILNPLSEDELRIAVAACQHDNATTPEGIKPCIIDKTSSIIVASNTPPAPPVPTELEAPAAATVAAAPAATVAVPAASVAAVPQPPVPPTEVTAAAPEAAPAPVVQGTSKVATAPAQSVALSAFVVEKAPAPVVAVAAPAPQPAPKPVVVSAPAPTVVTAAPAPIPVIAAAPAPAPVMPVTPVVAVAVPAAPAPVTAVVSAPRPAPMPAAAPAVSPSSATLASTRPVSFDTILKVSLGMPIRDARKSFGTAVQDIETDADGDTDYTYMISDDHGFVDVFTNPANPDEVIGVSINGGADVEMQPIMGIRLGDGAFELLTRIGPPDRKVAVPGTERTRWIYGDRNYAFDVSNGGDIIGIRIYGNLGLPETTAAIESPSHE